MTNQRTAMALGKPSAYAVALIPRTRSASTTSAGRAPHDGWVDEIVEPEQTRPFLATVLQSRAGSTA